MRPWVTPTDIIDALVAEIDATGAADAARKQAEAAAARAKAAPPGQARTAHQFRLRYQADNRVARCRAYLAKLPGGVEGEHGSNPTFEAARVIWNDFHIEEPDGWPLLCEWNLKCSPPWPLEYAEGGNQCLRRKWEEAVDRGPCPKGRGWRLKENRPGYQNTAATIGGDAPPADGEAGTPAEPQVQANDDPNNPHRLAHKFLSVVSPNEGPPSYRMRTWRNEVYQYNHLNTLGAYTLRPDGDFKAELCDWIRAEAVETNLKALKAWAENPSEDKGEPPKTFKVTTQLVSNTAAALASINLLPFEVQAPAWIDGATGPDPAGILAFPNGLLVLEDAAAGKPDCLLPPDHQFFTTNVMPFPYTAWPPEPTEFLAFLKTIWPDDQESINCLQEWFGYLLTPDNRQQKILFLLGPKRAGKGTITRVLQALVGPENYAGLTMSGMTGEFGLAPLLGKTVAVFPDARLSGRTDATPIIERILAISGGDAVPVNRKHKDQITVKLTTRFVMVSNELPNLGDASGALASRFIILHFTESFYDREDIGLEARLLAELPGILQWAIEGWKRLQENGRFTQPAASRDVVQDMEDLASPVGAFVREQCELGGGHKIDVEEMYGAWKAWCEKTGKKEPGMLDMFGRNLKAVAPTVRKTRPRVPGGRAHVYTGIRLRPYSDEDMATPSAGVSSGMYADPGDQTRRTTFSNTDRW